MSKALFNSPPSSICIIRLSAIGDVTHMLPIIATLQQQWPETKITWVIGKVEYQLVKQLEGINFVIFNKGNGYKEYLNLRKHLKPFTFDALLMMQTSLRASLISLMIKAKIKLGFDKTRAHDYQSFFSSHQIQGDTRIHVLDSFFLFLKALGITQKKWDWLLKSNDSSIQFVNKNINAKKYVVINPSSSIRRNNYRNWSNDNYAKIIDYLENKHQIKVVLTGGPSDEEAMLANNIIKQCKTTPINLVGKTNLIQLLAVLEQAHFMIAPDTGPAHMGTVAGIPVIGLFASSNPLRTGPYNSQETNINVYPEAIEKYLNKSVTTANWGERVRVLDVMSMVTIDRVQQKIDGLL